MTEESRARIGIIAADPLRRLGLESILQDVVGLRAFSVDLEGALADGELAAVLLDARSASDALLDTIGRLRRDRSGLKVIVMGSSLDPDFVQSVIGAGAKGYLPETAHEGEIRMAMEVVLDGSVWAPRKVLARLIDAGAANAAGASGSGGANESVMGKMTRRELDVLELLLEGRSNREIADALRIDEVTVKAHLGRMLRKTGASNRVELTLRALEEKNLR
jgi:DNA-binding NarL/FixJ family response regulator